MFKFDRLNNPKPYDLYLCKPDGSIICYLNGIDESSASVTVNLNNQLELSFNYNKYIIYNGKKVMSNGFDSLAYGMKILVDELGYFKIDYPPVNFDGEKTIMSVTATSTESELEDKDLVGFKINTGELDSLEYLVSYDDNETETLINEYTGLPYDYIVFYNTFPEQLQKLLNKYGNNTTISSAASIAEIVDYCKLIPRLKNKVTKSSDGKTSVTEYVSYNYNTAGDKVVSIYLSSQFNARISTLITFYTKYRKQLSLIDLALEKCNCNWEVGNIDPKLVNRKYQFDINGSNIYSFLTQDIAKVSDCIVSFDLYQKKIHITPVEDIGVDSKVILDKKNLLNTIDITCDENGICTRYNVTGGNDIGIQYVNFGSSRIDDLSYFLSARNENNQLIYVTESLAEKYRLFVDDRNLARAKYMELTKAYNASLTSIDEIKYRVPNDEIQNDWDTFTNAELESSLKVYDNLLATLITLYKEDFGSVGCNSDGSIKESFIKTTMYWYDYYAYNIAIEQINATIVARANNSSYAEISDEEILAKINAWKTEWSLFGTVELQNKVNAYDNNMTVLVDGQAVILKPNSKVAKKWSELTADEKTEYGSLDINYQYDIYMQNYNERNSCQTYLNTLMSKLNSLEKERDSYASQRKNLVKLVTVEGYDRSALGRIVTLPSSTITGKFSDSEIKTINLLYIDKNYSNENILTTSLDTSVSEVDIQYELLKDAEEQLSKDCQPQISFNTGIDNLLCMPEFKDYDFRVGNYIIVEYYDNYYVKLRLSSITFNPLVPTDPITVSFTNYIKSKSGRSDLSHILGLAVGSSSNSSSSGGGSGSFGESDKIDVTISNTMLSKLLNTEMFGTRVSNIILDTIKVNQITAKYAKFDGLAKGTTTIDGQCIKTGVIVSNNYNGTKNTTSTGVITYGIDNTLGSIIRLSDGTFNLAGGSLKYDGSLLNIKAHLNAQTLSTGGKVRATSDKDGLYVDSDGNLYIGASNTTVITKDGTGHIGAWNFNSTQFYNQTITGNSDGYIGLATSDFARIINGTSRSLRFAIGSKFGVTKEGKIYAADITIDAGYIGGSSGFVIASGKIYSNSHNIYNHANNGVYIGTDYIALGSGGETWFKHDGTFSLGNGKITFNGTNIQFSSDVSLTWAQISDATSKATQITKDTITTSYINALNVKAGSVDAENITGTTITGKTFSGCTGDFSGKITATTGKIANFTISGGYLYNGIGIGTDGSCGISCGSSLSGSDDWIFWAGNGTFRVNKNGSTYVTDIEIKNNIYMYTDTLSRKKVFHLYEYSTRVAYLNIGAGVSGVSFGSGTTGKATIYSDGTANFKTVSLGTGSYDLSCSSASIDKIDGTVCSTDLSYKVPVGSSGYEQYYTDTIRSTSSGLRVYGNFENGIDGNYTRTSKTFAASTSDERLKENIFNTDVNNALDQILAICHKQFDWKATKEHVDLGYIAQELEKINPSMVIKPDDEDDTYGINTFYLMSIITKAIQELYQILVKIEE